MSRLILGLSVGSGLEGIDAAAVRCEGLALELAPAVIASVRVAFPPVVREAIRTAPRGSFLNQPDLTRNVAETAVHAARQVLAQAAASPRDTFAVGLLEPGRPAVELAVPWSEIADRVAEQTGMSVVHGFRHRDRAAGGAGHPITVIPDYLLFRSPTQPRLVIHLGAVSSVVFIPPVPRVSAVIAFEAGPGNQLLDALIYHGTRGKAAIDPGGKKAVQGRCLEPLLARWQDHPHLTRTPPKTVHPDAFGRSFLLAAFEATRQLAAGLPDLLCTATHLVARSLREAVSRWLPSSKSQAGVLLTGGGVRNGFLWQLVGQQVGSESLTRSDRVGVPALARTAAGAALLAALTCDGVAGNLATSTGAAGGRLLGHLAPGDGRNWARLAGWIADQAGDYPRMHHAA
jgi:anhydro-N-acetylmuramic acid kinase